MGRLVAFIRGLKLHDVVDGIFVVRVLFLHNVSDRDQGVHGAGKDVEERLLAGEPFLLCVEFQLRPEKIHDVLRIPLVEDRE